MNKKNQTKEEFLLSIQWTMWEAWEQITNTLEHFYQVDRKKDEDRVTTKRGTGRVFTPLPLPQGRTPQDKRARYL